MNYFINVVNNTTGAIVRLPNSSYPIENIKWEHRKIGGNWSLQFTIRNTGADYGTISHNDTVRLYVNDTLEFSGYIVDIDPHYGKDICNVQVNGYVKKLDTVLLGTDAGTPLVYSNQTIGATVIDILDNYIVSNTTISYGSADIDAEFFADLITFQNDEARAGIDQLADIQRNIRWGVDENELFYFKSYVKQFEYDANTVLLLHLNEGASNRAYDDVPEYVVRLNNTQEPGYTMSAVEWVSGASNASLSNTVLHNSGFTVEAWIQPTAYGEGDNNYLPTIFSINTYVSNEMKNTLSNYPDSVGTGYGYRPLYGLCLNGEYVYGYAKELTIVQTDEYWFYDRACKPESDTAKVPLNKWSHVAMVYDPNDASGSGSIALFVNGTKVQTSYLQYDEPTLKAKYEPLAAGTYAPFVVIGAQQKEHILYAGTPDEIKVGGFAGSIKDVRLTKGVVDVASLWSAGTYDFPLRNSADLLGMWRLHEGTGVTITDDSLSNYDLTLMGLSNNWAAGPTGGNNNCRLTASNIWTVSGKFENGWEFEDSGTVVSAGTDPAWATVGSNGSVEFWLRLNASDNHCIMMHGVDSGDWNFQIKANTSNKVYVERNGSSLDVVSSGVLNSDVWYYVAVTFGTGSLLNLYVNGSSVDTDALAGSLTGTADCNLMFGRDHAANKSGQFNIDDIKVRNSPQSAANIAAYWAAVVAQETPYIMPKGKDITFLNTQGNSDDVINRYRIEGIELKDGQHFVATVNNNKSQTDYGIREELVQNSIIATEATARRYGNALLSQTAEISKSGSITIKGYDGTETFTPDRGVRLRGFNSQYNGDYDLASVRKEISEGSLNIVLDLGQTATEPSEWFRRLEYEVNGLRKQVNSLGGSLSESRTIGVSDFDTTPPGQVTGLTISNLMYIDPVTGRDASRFKVSWTARTESDLANYEIQMYGSEDTTDSDPYFRTIAIANSGETEYLYTGSLQCGEEYRVRIRAVDRSGNKGQWSETEVFTAPQDTTAPAAPTITVTPCTHGNIIDIVRPSESDYDEIWIAADTTSGPTTYIYKGRGNSYIHETHSGDTEYFYRAKVKDYSSNLSEWSLSGTGTTLTLPIDHNLIQNGGFRQVDVNGLLRHWTDNTSGILKVLSSDAVWGESFAKISTSSKSVSSQVLANGFYANDEYHTMSLYLKKITGSNPIEVQIGYEKPTGGGEYETLYISNTTWQRFTYTLQLDFAGSGYYQPSIIVKSFGMPDHELHVDCVMVQRGSRASELWVPNWRETANLPYVYGADIASRVIQGSKINSNQISGGHIVANAISGGHILDGSVDTSDIASNSIYYYHVHSNGLLGHNIAGVYGKTVSGTLTNNIIRIHVDGHITASGGLRVGSFTAPGVGQLLCSDFVGASDGLHVGGISDPGSGVALFDGIVKGTRHTIQLTYQPNITLNNGDFTWLKDGESDISGYTGGVPMPRDGSIVSVGYLFNLTTAAASGTLIIQVYKNGSFVWNPASISASSTGIKRGAATQARNADSFSAGDFISARVYASAVPSGVDIEDVYVTVECYYDD